MLAARAAHRESSHMVNQRAAAAESQPSILASGPPPGAFLDMGSSTFQLGARGGTLDLLEFPCNIAS